MKRHIKPSLIIFCSLLLTHSLFAKPADEKFSKKKFLRAAEEAFKAGNIYAATDLYLKILENAPEEKSILFQLGQSYFLARDYENASVYFLQSYEDDSIGNALALYYAAL